MPIMTPIRSVYLSNTRNISLVLFLERAQPCMVHVYLQACHYCGSLHARRRAKRSVDFVKTYEQLAINVLDRRQGVLSFREIEWKKYA